MPTHILPISLEKPPLFSADDRILLGEGLFETIRVVEGRPCYGSLHWQRLYNAALSLSIPFELAIKQWHEQLVNCIHLTAIQNGGIKVILSGGPARRGLHQRGETSLLLFEAYTYLPQQQAWSLVSAPWLRDAKNPIYQLKSVNYLESILARRQALAAGADDALFYNLEHGVTETTIANIFIIKQNQIYTPMLSCGVLAGIIRSRILCLCLESGINCTEVFIDKKTMDEADAVFVSNALNGIVPIKSIDGHPLSIQHPLINLLQEMLSIDPSRWD